jgi:hypothetical protein
MLTGTEPFHSLLQVFGVLFFNFSIGAIALSFMAKIIDRTPN